MSLTTSSHRSMRLGPEVNRILYVKNLPFKITSEEMYDLFGQYGAIRQIRLGTDPKTRGTAYVVYEDIMDSKNACEHLQGFNVLGRYLVVMYHRPSKIQKKPVDLDKKEQELKELKQEYNIDE